MSTVLVGVVGLVAGTIFVSMYSNKEISHFASKVKMAGEVAESIEKNVKSGDYLGLLGSGFLIIGVLLSGVVKAFRG